MDTPEYVDYLLQNYRGIDPFRMYSYRGADQPAKRKPSDEEVLYALFIVIPDEGRRKADIVHNLNYYFQHTCKQPVQMASWSQIRRCLGKGVQAGWLTVRYVERGHFHYYEWRKR